MSTKIVLLFLLVLIAVVECHNSHLVYHPSCILPKHKGRYCNALTQRYWHNIRTGECQPFTYRGCGGNQNNFYSYDECYAMCRIPWNEKKFRRKYEGGHFYFP